MSDLWQSLLLILMFTLIGGLFAASETALVSLRESQVVRLSGSKRGKRLARLMAKPNRFLAAVQVGVTLAGFVSAGYGAAELTPYVEPILTGWGLPSGLSGTLAFSSVTLLIAYLSLVLGELVPKRLALQRAEQIALTVAVPVDILAAIFSPFIWLLGKSSDILLRILGADPAGGREAITGEELRDLVATHEELSHEERQLIDDVFSTGERELREVMIPRTEVQFLDADMPAFKAAKLVSAQPHSRYPVMRSGPDDVVGFVHVRDILAPDTRDRSIRVETFARDVAYFPGSKRVLPALTEMRRTGQHFAIVADEYGGTAGIVTLEDLVEELVGDIHDEYDVYEVREKGDGSETLVVDGLLNIEDFSDESGVALPDGPYETVAGFVVHRLGRLPQIGDEADYDGHTLRVIELDGRRAARIEVSISREANADETTTPDRLPE